MSLFSLWTCWKLLYLHIVGDIIEDTTLLPFYSYIDVLSSRTLNPTLSCKVILCYPNKFAFVTDWSSSSHSQWQTYSPLMGMGTSDQNCCCDFSVYICAHILSLKWFCCHSAAVIHNSSAFFKPDNLSLPPNGYWWSRVVRLLHK